MMVRLKWFTDADFQMDGQNVADRMDADFLLKLDACRDLCGFPFIVTSSFRTAEKNRRVGGASGSLHLVGRAVDVRCVDGENRAAIVRHALSLGLSVGIMKEAVHLDNRMVAQVVFHYYDRYEASKSQD